MYPVRQPDARRPAEMLQLLGDRNRGPLQSFAGGDGVLILPLVSTSGCSPSKLIFLHDSLELESSRQKKETGRPIVMAPTGYETYINGRFTEDDDQFIHAPLGSSPLPAYDVAVAEMATYNGQGLVYHRLVQRPSPPPSHHSAPLSVQVSRNLNSPAQQSAASTNFNDTWTPEQNRFVLRLDKAEGKSLQDISNALKQIFHVKRDTNTIARQLAYLWARGKALSDDQLKQAIEETMQQLNQVLPQEELSVTGNLSGSPPDSAITSTGTPTATDDEQLADVELAVRLELDQMLRNSSVGADLKQRMFNEQKERNAECAAMMIMDLGKDSIEDYEVV
ncbi:hypothetical protein B0T13DRAFT_503191 [Neurospora crassa]|nr:hypothetical protein B0T13DRAFT_503191 [Neurospora crassa]